MKGLCIGKSRKGNNATGYSNEKAEGNIIKQLFEECETKKLCKKQDESATCKEHRKVRLKTRHHKEHHNIPQQKAADSFCIKLLLGSAGLFLGWLCWLFKTCGEGPLVVGGRLVFDAWNWACVLAAGVGTGFGKPPACPLGRLVGIAP